MKLATTRPGIYKTPEGEHAVKAAYRQLLQHWPVPAQQHTVPTRQGDTFVVTSGPAGAPPLVLLHGSGANSLVWAGHVATWAEHFRVHAIDVIGEPGLSAPSRPLLDTGAHAAWLDDVLDALALTRSAIVGTSLGGWLALDYAIRRPGRVTRLALMAPGGVGRQKWGVVIIAILLLPFGRRGQMITLRRAVGVPAAADVSPRAAALGGFTLLVHRHFRPRLDRLPLFSAQALAGLDMPVLTIVGGRDAMLDSHQTRQRLEQAGKTVQLIPEAGHHLLPDQTQPILDFLRG